MTQGISGKQQVPVQAQPQLEKAEAIEKSQSKEVGAGFQRDNSFSHTSGTRQELSLLKPTLDYPSPKKVDATTFSEIATMKETTKSDVLAAKLMKLGNAQGKELPPDMKTKITDQSLKLMSIEKMPETTQKTINQQLDQIQKSVIQSDDFSDMQSLLMSLQTTMSESNIKMQEGFQKHAQEKLETVRKLTNFLNHLVDDAHDAKIGGEWKGDRINNLLKSYGLDIKLSRSELMEFHKLRGKMESGWGAKRTDARRQDFMEGVVKMLFKAADIPLPSNLKVFTEKMVNALSKEHDGASMYAPDGGLEASDQEHEKMIQLLSEVDDGIALAGNYQELAMQYFGEQLRKTAKTRHRI